MPTVLEQTHFRLRTGTNSVNATPVWGAAEDADWEQALDAAFRVRFAIQETGAVAASATQFKVQYQRNGSGLWTDIGTGSSFVKAVDASTTNDDTGITASHLTGTGTFVNGRYDETGAIAVNITVGASGRTELEFGLQLVSADLAHRDVLELRVATVSGTAISIYQRGPVLAVWKPPAAASPPGHFDAVAEAQAAGKTVRAAALAFFDIEDHPTRVWTGKGDLIAGGETWQGIGLLTRSEAFDQLVNGTAGRVRFIVSGVDAEMLAIALDEAEKIKNREVTAYLQFFDEDWATLSEPQFISARICDTVELAEAMNREGGEGAKQISIEAGDLFVERSRSPYSYYSDYDQKRLYAGDKFCERIPLLLEKEVPFPDF